MDRTDLVPVTASTFWLCRSDPDSEKRYLEPGACRDGAPRDKAFAVRPHGDHNPRHGGPSVFMSEDLYHHVEATLVAPTPTRPAAFRVYLYDEYTRPIRAAGISAHVALADKNGKAIRSPTPLVVARIRDGNAMEVRLPNGTVPSENAPAFFTLRVKFKPSDKDWVTDHTFTSLLEGVRAHPLRRRDRHCRDPFGIERPRSVSDSPGHPARRQTGICSPNCKRAWIRSQSSGRKAVSAASGIRRFAPKTSR